MPFRQWLDRFLNFEARSGGGMPAPQLFPCAIDSDPSSEDFSDHSRHVNISTNESERNALFSAGPTAAITRVDPGAEDSNSSSSMASSGSSHSEASPPPPPPPPPTTPPPLQAIQSTTPTTTAVAKNVRVVKVRDVGCSTLEAFEAHAAPRFYSRFVFMRTVTALQLLWAYFTFALWNYFAHIRWYGASFATVGLGELAAHGATTGGGEGGSTTVELHAPLSVTLPKESVEADLVTGKLHSLSNQWLAVAYLAFALAGLTYTVSAVLYVCVVNTPRHVRAAWPYPQLVMKACCADHFMSLNGQRGGGGGGAEYDNDDDDANSDPFRTYGPVMRPQPTAPLQTPAAPMDLAASVSTPQLRSAMNPSNTEFSSVLIETSQVYSPSFPSFSVGVPPRRASVPTPVSTTALPAYASTAPPSSIAPLSFTQPQFLFPLHRVGVLDQMAANAANATIKRSATGHGASPAAVSSFEVPFQSSGEVASTPALHAPSNLSQRRVSYDALLTPSATHSSPYGPTASYPPPLPQRQPSARPHRGDPKAPLLWCAFPVVLVLVIFDFMIIRGCRVRGWPVRLLQGLSPALGLLLLLYTLQSVVVVCVRCCVVCWTTVPINVYAPARPPMYRGYGPEADPRYSQWHESNTFVDRA